MNDERTENEPERSPREKYSNGVCEEALSAATELSRLGTVDKGIRKRLARLIGWLREGLNEYDAEKNMIIARWAERDPESNEMKVQTMEDSKGIKVTKVLMRNDAEARMELNELFRERIHVDGNPPDSFTWDELDEHFTIVKDGKRKPGMSPELAARLGPFCALD